MSSLLESLTILTNEDKKIWLEPKFKQKVTQYTCLLPSKSWVGNGGFGARF